ncbi:glycosyltransferase family 4 protein [Enterococcus casseliflavus]|uniref:glycosyltransferase family 4 protein n=1 Tax=Enterococcus casseliflavus TaxID=37734 RepID=UPI0035D739DD
MINILFLHAGAEMYGADKVLLDLLKHLDKKKFKPYVILPSEGVLLEALEKENIHVEVVPYPIMRRKYFNPVGVLKYCADFLKYSKVITNKAKQNNVDIVHANTAATMEGCYVSRKLKVPLLWSIHEIIVTPNFMFKMTSKCISKFSSITITDSMAVKRHLLSSGYFKDNDIKVIYNGVDSTRFKPQKNYDYLYEEFGIPKESIIIGMTGRVNSWKGQGDFLKAANIVMEKYPNVYTVFIGSAFEGEEWREDKLASDIKKSKFKERIINKGYRTDSEAFYNLFDIFVLPSTNPDPLPTVVLESMASGKPIVGYRHGGVCEMVNDHSNGLLAEVGDINDLAEKIEILLKNDKLRNNMGKNSRERLLEKFSLEAYIDNYSREYNKLLRK